MTRDFQLQKGEYQRHRRPQTCKLEYDTQDGNVENDDHDKKVDDDNHDDQTQSGAI